MLNFNDILATQDMIDKRHWISVPLPWVFLYWIAPMRM